VLSSHGIETARGTIAKIRLQKSPNNIAGNDISHNSVRDGMIKRRIIFLCDEQDVGLRACLIHVFPAARPRWALISDLASVPSVVLNNLQCSVLTIASNARTF